VYPIHVAWPLWEPDPATRSRASHFLGTTYALRARLRQHGAGQDAPIMRVVRDQELPWFVAKTWVVGRTLEWALKCRHNNPSLCPACRFAPWGSLGARSIDDEAPGDVADIAVEGALEDRHDRGEVAS
jgi:hypothetical protein